MFVNCFKKNCGQKMKLSWDTFYIYEGSALINHLFIGKDIAVRREKMICESSRFLRAHTVTP